MGRVYAIANQKGGVGKTTTSVNAAASVAVAERRTLLIDMDPQGNATSGLGVVARDLSQGTYDVLLGRARLEDVLVSSPIPHLKLCPATPLLVGGEIELIDMDRRELLLRQPFLEQEHLEAGLGPELLRVLVAVREDDRRLDADHGEAERPDASQEVGVAPDDLAERTEEAFDVKRLAVLEVRQDMGLEPELAKEQARRFEHRRLVERGERVL